MMFWTFGEKIKTGSNIKIKFISKDHNHHYKLWQKLTKKLILLSFSCRKNFRFETKEVSFL